MGATWLSPDRFAQRKRQVPGTISQSFHLDTNKLQESHPGDAFRSSLPPACPLTCSWPPTEDLVESTQTSTPNPGREEKEDKKAVRLKEEEKKTQNKKTQKPKDQTTTGNKNRREVSMGEKSEKELMKLKSVKRNTATP